MPTVSFETFPPRSDAARDRLDACAAALGPMAPAWFSVTCGAGGGDRDGTVAALRRLKARTSARLMAHLPLAAQSRAETMAAAGAFREAGASDLLALRGDGADGPGSPFAPHPDGFRDVPELLAALAAEHPDATLRVAAYPEAHPDAEDPHSCLEWLRAKLDAGAAEAVTQFFFAPETFLRFRDRAAGAGIDAARLVPGLLPVSDWPKAERFAASCGAAVPPDLAEGFDRAHRHGRADAMALAQCCELADALRAEGVDRLHFYTLNRPEPVASVCRALGLGEPARAVA